MTSQHETESPSKEMLIMALSLSKFLMGAEDMGYRFTFEDCELQPGLDMRDIYMTDTHNGAKLSFHHLMEDE